MYEQVTIATIGSTEMVAFQAATEPSLVRARGRVRQSMGGFSGALTGWDTVG